MELINTPECYLMAALKLQLSFLISENTLNLTGETNISKAQINLDQQKNSTITKSKDIVISQNNTLPANNHPHDSNLKILPNIDFRIDPAAKLSGKGLNANVSGKLKVYADRDNDTILAEGRVSIKRGIYNLLGKEYVIDKGRFIYLPGTVISNPSLDIKITPKSSEIRQQNSEQKFLYIEGTLDKPIINDNGLANEQQAVLQLLSLSNNVISNNIKDALNLQEFGIQENDTNSNQFKGQTDDESLLGNKNFVIGKKINQNFYVQYLKTLINTNNTVKLQYKLSPNWYIGVESSSEEGHGADIGFSLEK
jgi:autotransporter translocation and assembly factor TamB